MSFAILEQMFEPQNQYTVVGLSKAQYRLICPTLSASNLLSAFFSSSLSFKCALRESGSRIGYDRTKNESRLLLAVDILGHQCGGFCVVPYFLLNLQLE